MRRVPLLFALVLTASALVGATSVDDAIQRVRERTRPEPAAVADRLFCGMSIPGGGFVTDGEVELFLAEVVEPRFPDGFTIWRARGQWRGGSEETLVLEIVHPPDAALDAKVREIGLEYQRRFRQSAVLRVRTPAEMDFLAE